MKPNFKIFDKKFNQFWDAGHYQIQNKRDIVCAIKNGGHRVLIQDLVFIEATGISDLGGITLDWYEGDLFDNAGGLRYIVKDQGCFWLVHTKHPQVRVACHLATDWPIRKIGNVLTHPNLL